MTLDQTQDDISFSGLINESWQILKQHWSTIYLMGGIAFGVQILLTILQEQLFGPEGTDPTLMSVLFSLLNSVVSMVLGAGIIGVMLKIVRGETVDIPDLLSNKSSVIQYFLSAIVVGFTVFIGFILLIIPGIIFAVKYGYAQIIAVDKKLGPMEAMRLSAQMTNGKILKIMGLGTGLVLLNIAGVLALLVGLLVTMPLTGIAQMLLYTKLLAQVEGSTQSTLDMGTAQGMPQSWQPTPPPQPTPPVWPQPPTAGLS